MHHSLVNRRFFTYVAIGRHADPPREAIVTLTFNRRECVIAGAARTAFNSTKNGRGKSLCTGGPHASQGHLHPETSLERSNSPFCAHQGLSSRTANAPAGLGIRVAMHRRGIVRPRTSERVEPCNSSCLKSQAALMKFRWSAIQQSSLQSS